MLEVEVNNADYEREMQSANLRESRSFPNVAKRRWPMSRVPGSSQAERNVPRESDVGHSAAVLPGMQGACGDAAEIQQLPRRFRRAHEISSLFAAVASRRGRNLPHQGHQGSIIRSASEAEVFFLSAAYIVHRQFQMPSDVLNESPSNSIDYSSEMTKVDIKTIYRDHQPISSTSPPTRDKIHSEEKTRTRRALNREKRGLKTGRSYTEELSVKDETNDITAIKNSRNLSEGLSNILRDNKSEDVATRILLESEKSKRKEKLKDIADSLTRPRSRGQLITSSERRSSSQVKPTRDGEYSEEEKTGYASSSPVAREEDVDGTVEKPVSLKLRARVEKARTVLLKVEFRSDSRRPRRMRSRPNITTVLPEL